MSVYLPNISAKCDETQLKFKKRPINIHHYCIDKKEIIASISFAKQLLLQTKNQGNSNTTMDAWFFEMIRPEFSYMI